MKGLSKSTTLNSFNSVVHKSPEIRKPTLLIVGLRGIIAEETLSFHAKIQQPLFA